VLAVRFIVAHSSVNEVFEVRDSICAVLLVGVLGLAACQPRAHKDPLADEPQAVPSGSTFTLNKGIVIPAGSAGVYFQDTQLVASDGLRRGYPYCTFGSDQPASTARELKPQVFTVGSVGYEEQASGPTGESVSLTRISLLTAQKIKGYSMICGSPGPAAVSRFVTVSEINGAVGDYFTLKRLF
jgi:hypothetical protein